MFDVILNKIKECVSSEVSQRLSEANKESTIVKIAPQSYDRGVCLSKLEVMCVAKSYERALLSFDAICEGLEALPIEENEILEIELDSTVIKYDTVSGMTRLLGVFKAYTEVLANDN
ncbi:MAG: hypothetical protein J6A54_04160 [Clostridia bacterium]|nr:hypothetical protein [Clostridia bacterium]